MPGAESSTGPLAMTDLDGTGTEFVRGRAGDSAALSRKRRPRFYSSAPMMPGSWMRENTKALQKVGLVNGAVFSDLDGDGYPDLFSPANGDRYGCSTMTKGDLHEITRRLSRDYHTADGGMGYRTGDFNGDGRPDIIACNWGRNTKYESARTSRCGFTLAIFRTAAQWTFWSRSYDESMRAWVPWQPLRMAAAALPFLRERWQTHEAYGRASFEEIYGDVLKKTRLLEANWLETTLFLNMGDHFEAHGLCRWKRNGARFWSLRGRRG